jgi:glycosyltransferase involved in cell wall biosynthesis
MNEAKPIVTVLMPVYNAGSFLNEAMDSILNQTFKNFEFLIIDDCSKDNSVELIEGYKDERIRLIKNERNMGVAATLNKGIQLASCELIARMDADDYSYLDRLEKQVNYFQNIPDCVLLYTFSRKISADRSSSVDKIFNTKHLYYNLIFHCPIRHPSVMYKRSVVMEVGMYDKTFVEDFNLWFRISRKYKLHCLKEILFEYRVTDFSTSRVSRKKESDEAYYRQVLSNVHFYTGADFQLSREEVLFLRGIDIQSVVQSSDRKFFIGCFRKLDFITQCVGRGNTVGLTKSAFIRAAAFEKKEKLINGLLMYRDKGEAFSLLYELKYWKFLVKSLAKRPFLNKRQLLSNTQS